MTYESTVLTALRETDDALVNLDTERESLLLAGNGLLEAAVLVPYSTPSGNSVTSDEVHPSWVWRQMLGNV